jgi:hypothetical protein
VTFQANELGYTREDRLYKLLPGFLRERDALDGGQSLRALCRVISEQLNVIEDDIERLLDNAFIETCEPWAVPYIAALVGFELAEAPAADELSPDRRDALVRAIAPRRLAANTIRHRRRKGTLAVLEDLAWDLAGWTARAMEQRAGVLRTAHTRYVVDSRSRLADLRDADAIDRLDGPFSSTARCFDSRLAAQTAPDGVSLFVWRNRIHRVDRAPARPLPPAACSDGDLYAFTFSQVGGEAPLYQRPIPARDPTGIATELEVPAPIRPLAFRLHVADYYGEGMSLAVWTRQPSAADKPGNDFKLIPLEYVVPADLGPKAPPIELEPGELAIDPARGLLLWRPPENLNRDQHDEPRLWVTYHRGAPADLGGGGYTIDPGEPPAIPLPEGEEPSMVVRALVRKVDDGDPDADPPDPAPLFRRIHDAVQDVGHRLDSAPEGAVGVVEILDDAVYHEDLHVRIKPGRSLIVRAGAGRRPIIWLHQHTEHRAHVEGHGGGRLSFEGIWFAPGRLAVRGDLDLLAFRHSTLVPEGLGGQAQGSVLELEEFRGALDARHCVLGSVVVRHERRDAAPPRLTFADSAIDGGPVSSSCEAIHGGGRHAVAYARVTFERCTVVGPVRIHALDHASDSIFTGSLIVARRRRGQLTFCHVPRGSQTPARYRCQPDLEIAAAQTTLAEDVDAAARRVAPPFLSSRFGDARYLVLPDDAPAAILRGAQDGSEMGVYHDLFFAPRATALAALADEYTPAGFFVDLIFIPGN